MSLDLERAYRLLRWRGDDPESEEGKRRYEELREDLSRYLKEELLELGKEVKILDLCSGSGIGGVALANFLHELGKKVNLTLMDLRKSVLENYRKWDPQEGISVRKIVGDIRKDIPKGPYDVISMFGLSMPHFSPREALVVFSRISKEMKERGIFLLEEHDRFYSFCIRGNYKDVIGERADPLTLSVHTDYDVEEGVIIRNLINLESGEKSQVRVHMWSIAELKAILSCFFKEVSFKRKGFTPYGYIIARSPRRKLNPEDFMRYYTFLAFYSSSKLLYHLI